MIIIGPARPRPIINDQLNRLSLIRSGRIIRSAAGLDLQPARHGLHGRCVLVFRGLTSEYRPGHRGTGGPITAAAGGPRASDQAAVTRRSL